MKGICSQPLLVTLIAAAGLAGLQQQILLRQPPRLLSLRIPPVHSAPAALDLTFSRPMRVHSLTTDSRLSPDLPHRWQGDTSPFRLLLEPGQAIDQPLQLTIAAEDRRGLAMVPRRWNWDPRPLLVVVNRTAQGEQVLLRSHDGGWQPLSAVHPRILQLEPLGNGAGVAYVTGDAQGFQQGWLRRLDSRSLVPVPNHPQPPGLGLERSLTPSGQMYVHLSADRRGDVLVQTGGPEPDSERVRLLDGRGRFDLLPVQPSGTMALLPAGGAVVLPSDNGLELVGLDQLRAGDKHQKRRQVLPGSRDLRAVCTGSGRALLVRHWPDYRRSVELVLPGQAPRQLWLGEQAVMAATCDALGQRIWLVLRGGALQGNDTLLELDDRGQVLRRRSLGTWRLEPNTSLDLDRIGRTLLMTLQNASGSVVQPALLSLDDGVLTFVKKPVTMARWLPAGAP